MENLVKINATELEVLHAIVGADHSSDGNGLCGYICYRDTNLLKKVFDSAVRSLTKKGVIDTEVIVSNGEKSVWYYVIARFQKKDPINCPREGFSLCNLELDLVSPEEKEVARLALELVEYSNMSVKKQPEVVNNAIVTSVTFEFEEMEIIVNASRVFITPTTANQTTNMPFEFFDTLIELQKAILTLK